MAFSGFLPSLDAMSLQVDTERLQRILSASLPADAAGAELFIESRLGVSVELSAPGDGLGESRSDIERRRESGAHLRRFFEKRHESFVLDAPTSASIEALVLHPEAITASWVSEEVHVGVPRPDPGPLAPGADRLDAIDSTSSGPWSASFLEAATTLLEGWLQALDRRMRSSGAIFRATASLDGQVQDVIVLSAGDHPKRDTRSFVDAVLRLDLTRARRTISVRQALSSLSLTGLAASAGGAGDLAAELHRRALERMDAIAPPREELPVIFASPSGGFLLHEVCGHLLEADHIIRGTSPFVAARGKSIASQLLTLSDDGAIEGMRGSLLFDDEGATTRRTPLILGGKLAGFLSDRLTAFSTGGASTGNGRRQTYRDTPMPRTTNLIIEPGDEDSAHILSGTGRGLLVERLGRGHVEPATGHFALAVEEAHLIAGGRVDAPVAARCCMDGPPTCFRRSMRSAPTRASTGVRLAVSSKARPSGSGFSSRRSACDP